MEEIQLRIFCLSEALKYIGNTNKGVQNVVNVAETFEAYLTGTNLRYNSTKSSAVPSSENVINFTGVHNDTDCPYS